MIECLYGDVGVMPNEIGGFTHSPIGYFGFQVFITVLGLALGLTASALPKKPREFCSRGFLFASKIIPVNGDYFLHKRNQPFIFQRCPVMHTQ